MEQVYNAREKLMNIFIYIDFAKMWNAIKNFPELNCNFWKKLLLSLYQKFQDPSHGEKQS